MNKNNDNSKLTKLTDTEKKLFKQRFCNGENSDSTLEDVGEDFSLTREKIRQIEAKALRKIRGLSEDPPGDSA